MVKLATLKPGDNFRFHQHLWEVLAVSTNGSFACVDLNTGFTQAFCGWQEVERAVPPEKPAEEPVLGFGTDVFIPAIFS